MSFDPNKYGLKPKQTTEAPSSFDPNKYGLKKKDDGGMAMLTGGSKQKTSSQDGFVAPLDLDPTAAALYEQTQKAYADDQKRLLPYKGIERVMGMPEGKSKQELLQNRQNQVAEYTAINEEVSRKRAASNEARKAMQPLVAQAKDYINKDIDKFIDQSIEGYKVPKVKDIGKFVDETVSRMGLATDGYFRQYLYNEVKANVAFKIIEPEVNQEFKTSLEGLGIDKKLLSEYEKSASFVNGIKSQAKIKQAQVKNEVSTKAKQESDAALEAIGAALFEPKTLYEQLYADNQQQAQQLTELYNTKQIDFDGYKDALGKITESTQKAQDEYNAKVNEAQAEYMRQSNAIYSKANQRLARQYAEVAKGAELEIEKRLSELKFKPSPELQKEIEKAYSAAYGKVLKKKENQKEILDSIASPGYNAVRTYVNTLGSTLKNISAIAGYEEGRVLGDYIQGLFQPGTSEIKGVKDLLDMNKVAKSSGSLAGSMTVSMGASATAGMLTGGLGAIPAMAAAAVAGWGTETAIQMGDMYDRTFEKTGDVALAEKRAGEILKGQIAISPTYAFEGLPFVKGALRGIRSQAGRMLVGGGIEFLSELSQEYPQGLIEEAVSNDQTFAEAYKYHTGEKLKSTALNVALVAPLGILGQVNSVSSSKLQRAAEIDKSAFTQFVTDMIKDKGVTFAKMQAGLHYNLGELTEEEAMVYFETIDKIATELEALASAGVPEGKQKELIALQAKAEPSQSEGIVGAIENATAKEAKQELNNVIQGETSTTQTVLVGSQPLIVLPSEGAALEKENITNKKDEKEIRDAEEESLLEGVRGRGTQDEGGQEGSQLRTKEEVKNDVSRTESKVEPAENPALRDVDSTTKALRENEEKGGKLISTTLIDDKTWKELNDKGVLGLNNIISEAYHKAKADGSNPELVKAVEQLLGKPKEATPKAETPNETTQATDTIPDGEARPSARKSDTKGATETVQPSVEPRGGEGSVEVGKEIDTLQKEIDTLTSSNPKEFTKSGQVRKGSKIIPLLKALNDKILDKKRQLFSAESDEVASAESRANTDAINKAFEERQEELAEKSNLTEDEKLEASIYDKIAQGGTLNDNELAYANENFFLPDGYQLNKKGDLIKSNAENTGSQGTTQPSGSTTGKGQKDTGGTRKTTQAGDDIGTAKRQADDIVDFLDSLKIDTKGTAQALGILPELWNTSIDIVKAAVKAGDTVAQAIEKGVQYLKDQGVSFDENAYRDTLNPTKERVELNKKKRSLTQRALQQDPSKEGKFSDRAINYEELPNKISLARANSIIAEQGISEAQRAAMDMRNGMKGATRAMLLQALIAKHQASASHDLEIELIEFLAELSTDQGQFIQALSAYGLITPDGALRVATRAIQKSRQRKAKADKPRTDKMIDGLKKSQEEIVSQVLEKKGIVQKKTDASKISIREASRKAGWGEKNRIFTKKMRDDAKKELKKMFFSAPIPPQLIIEAGYQIEAGAIAAKDFVDVMVDEFGNKVIPYLKEAYKQAKSRLIDEGFDAKGFDDESVIDTSINEMRGQKVLENIKKAIASGNKKDIDKAIASITNVAKDTGLWGKYRDMAVKRLKAMPVTSIQKDVKENALLNEFTEGLIKNVRQQMAEALPETQKTKLASKPSIEIIADAYKNLEKYQEAWTMAQQEMQKKYKDDPKALEALDVYFGDILAKPFSKGLLKSAIKEEMRSMEVIIADVVKSHYTVYDATKQTLTDKLVEKAGLPKQEADQLAKEIQAEFDKIAYEQRAKIIDKILTKKEKKEGKKKGLEEEILKLTNLGMFNDTELLNSWAKLNDYPQLTEQDARIIRALANEVQSQPDGLKRLRAIEDLLAYQANIKGVSSVDLAISVWYANILSGVDTHAVNSVANIFLTTGEFLVSAINNPMSVPIMARGILYGYKRGLLEGKETFKTGYSPIKGKVEIPSVLERYRFTGFKKPLNYAKYVRRSMVAADVFMYEINKEMKAFQLARKMSKNLEPTQQELNSAAEIIGITDYQVREAQGVAEMEYNEEVERIDQSSMSDKEKAEALKLAERSRKRRVYELVEQNRPEEIRITSSKFAARATLNYPPEGIIGWGSRIMNYAKDQLNRQAEDADTKIGRASANAAKIMVNQVIPFTNIIANAANQYLNYTPVGALRAASGKTALTYKGQELSEQEKVDLYTKAIMGTALATALLMLTAPGDEGEEPFIGVTARGFGDYAKNQTLVEGGWKEYSVRVGKTWYSYQYTPLFFMFSWVGNIRDFEKYRKEKVTDVGFLTKVSVSIGYTASQLLDATYISSLSSFLKAVTDTNNEDRVADFFNGIKKSVAGLVMPSIIPQTSKRAQDVFEIHSKEIRETHMGAVLQHIPFARDMYYDKINALGEPVVADTDKFISFSENKYLWDLLAEKAYVINIPAFKELIFLDKDAAKMRIATQQEYYEFAKLRGAFIKNYMEENYDKLKNMPKDEFAETMSSKASKATSKAKERLFDQITDIKIGDKTFGGTYLLPRK